MNYRLEKEESRRYDVLKALMCVFVLVIHAFSDNFGPRPTAGGRFLYDCTLVLSRIICDCAVPVFILMSSVLLYAKPIRWWANLKKKARSLLIPYFIFNTLWIVMMFCKHILGKKLGIVAGDDIDFSTYSVVDWLDAYLGVIKSGKPILSVLWYVRDLFLLNILAIPIKKLVDLLPVPMLLLTLVVWIFDIQLIVFSPYSVCFFILGYYLVKYGIHFSDFDAKLDKYLVILAFVVILVADSILLRSNAIVNRAFILVSVVFYIRFSGVLARFFGKAVDLIAPASFFIYLTHRFVYALFQAATGHSFKIYIVTYFLKPTVTLAVVLAVFYFMKRFLPGVLSVMVGGRVQKNKKINEKEIGK